MLWLLFSTVIKRLSSQPSICYWTLSCYFDASKLNVPVDNKSIHFCLFIFISTLNAGPLPALLVMSCTGWPCCPNVSPLPVLLCLTSYVLHWLTLLYKCHSGLTWLTICCKGKYVQAIILYWETHLVCWKIWQWTNANFSCQVMSSTSSVTVWRNWQVTSSSGLAQHHSYIFSMTSKKISFQFLGLVTSWIICLCYWKC